MVRVLFGKRRPWCGVVSAHTPPPSTVPRCEHGERQDDALPQRPVQLLREPDQRVEHERIGELNGGDQRSKIKK